MDHNFERLKNHILPLSSSQDFDVARLEWKLVDVEIHDDFDSCPCGKEIKELCYIKNQLTGNLTHVGNVCVNNFIGIKTGNLFAGLRRIAEDEAANPNEDLIVHAYRLGYIYENEYEFLMQTKLKRKLSPRQAEWKRKINRRIINKAVVRRSSSS